MDYKNPLNQLPKNPKRQAVIFLILTLLVSLGLIAAPQSAMGRRPNMVRRCRHLLDKYNELGGTMMHFKRYLAVLFAIIFFILAWGQEGRGQSSPPTATTDPASNVAMHSATLNGTVNPNGLLTDVSFLLHQDINAEPVEIDVPPQISGTSDTPVYITVNVMEGTTYFFKVRALNADGGSIGSELSFTTPPDALTNSATDVTLTSATLNGTVYADGTATAWFEYGTTSGGPYDSSTSQQNVTVSGLL